MHNILITGASGFLGTVVLQYIVESCESITKIGISEIDDISCNLACAIPQLNKRFDVVVHLAGKAHSIPKNKFESEQFFNVNVKGTVNLCKALEKSYIPDSFIYISSVAVYGVESGVNISEEHPLNGQTPYAKSKIQAEEYLKEWCAKWNVKLGIIRPSLIAGKNPPGNLGAMIHGIKTGKYLSIGKGDARKSVLMAEDIARIIPKIAEIGGTYNLCDDHHPSFRELEELIASQLNKKVPSAIPLWMAKSLALAGDLIGNKSPINSVKLDKITKPLTFSNEKAKRELNWKPMDVLENFQIS